MYSAPNDSIRRFIELRAQARIGALAPSDRAEYELVKEAFALAVCKAQGIAVQPGQRARASFRVAALFKVEITRSGSIDKTSTMDVHGGGFSSLLGFSIPPGTEASFRMNLSPKDAISGRVAVASATKERSGSLYRVAFTFTELKGADAALLEDALFDAVLPRKLTPAVMPSPPPTGASPAPPSPFDVRRAPSVLPPAMRSPAAVSVPPPPPVEPHRPRMKSVSEQLLDETIRAASEAPPPREGTGPRASLRPAGGASESPKSVEALLDEAMGEMRGSTEAARRETLPPRPPKPTRS